MINLKRLPEKINSRDKLVKELNKIYHVTIDTVMECQECGAIKPEGKRGRGRTGRYIYSREQMVIIIAYNALWEMGIEKSEIKELLKECSLEDIKEIQRQIKSSSYLKILDFLKEKLKEKKVKLDYEREGIRGFLDFKIP